MAKKKSKHQKEDSTSKYKKQKVVKAGTAFNKVGKTVPKETSIFIGKTLDIAVEINDLLDILGKKPVYLAKKLHKSESEISKWLSGYHNFTLTTLSKIEVVLDSNVILTNRQAKEGYGAAISRLKNKIKKLQQENVRLLCENVLLKTVAEKINHTQITPVYTIKSQERQTDVSYNLIPVHGEARIIVGERKAMSGMVLDEIISNRKSL